MWEYKSQQEPGRPVLKTKEIILVAMHLGVVEEAVCKKIV